MTNYAIIAGTGNLPKLVKNAIPEAKVVGFESDKPCVPTDLLTNFAAVGQVLEFLRANKVEKIIFAGGMKKPDFSSIKPDAEGAKLLAKIAAGKLFGRNKGDDFLLKRIISFLESKGFKVVGAHEVLGDLLTPKGIIAGKKPTDEEMLDIALGIKEAHEIGKADVGQAVIVQNGKVTGKEDERGTAELIKSAKGGILIKAKKPNQDERADLPSIGVETVEQCKAAGIVGIALEAGGCLVIDKPEVIKLANQHNIFVIGV